MECAARGGCCSSKDQLYQRFHCGLLHFRPPAGRIAVVGLSSFSEDLYEKQWVYHCKLDSMFVRLDEHLDWIRKRLGEDFCEF